MNGQDRELLLQDLCSRLPYKVICECSPINFRGTLGEISRVYEMCRLFDDFSDENVFIYDCKPYLFPLSSMTEEQREEYESLCIKETSDCTDLYGIIFTKDYYYNTIESIEFLYKNHIDIRGLIPKGLAIDCTGLNIY